MWTTRPLAPDLLEVQFSNRSDILDIGGVAAFHRVMHDALSVMRAPLYLLMDFTHIQRLELPWMDVLRTDRHWDDPRLALLVFYTRTPNPLHRYWLHQVAQTITVNSGGRVVGCEGRIAALEAVAAARRAK